MRQFGIPSLRRQRLRQAGPSSGIGTQQTQSAFAAPAGAFASIQDIPVGPSYVLGVGDEMTIYIWGRVESVLPVKVDRNGEIFIPSIGKLRVWGLSFEKAEELIRDHLARVYYGVSDEHHAGPASYHSRLRGGRSRPAGRLQP